MLANNEPASKILFECIYTERPVKKSRLQASKEGHADRRLSLPMDSSVVFSITVSESNINLIYWKNLVH